VPGSPSGAPPRRRHRGHPPAHARGVRAPQRPRRSHPRVHRRRDRRLDPQGNVMTAYLLAALDMAGTTVDEGGLVYAAVEDAVAEGGGRPLPGGLVSPGEGTPKEEAVGGLRRVWGSGDARR